MFTKRSFSVIMMRSTRRSLYKAKRNPFMETSENILYRTYTAVRDNISKVVVGKQDIIDKLLVAVFCRGHVLLEDVPGTGKHC